MQPHPLDPDTASILGIVFLIYGLVIVAVIVATYVLMAIALSAFFRKVGVAAWIAWIPFYAHWKWLEVSGQPGYLALFSLIPYFGSLVTSIFIYIGMYRSGIAFGKDPSFVVLGIFLPFVWLFMLGSRSSVYRPELLAARGYPAPLVGYGSAVGPYAPAA
ncbi:DUF5684 domain-containing protein [Glaciihabitans sp. dw_435]|uniref:DUF5684 domain-containing protein n=1 Tax=Glaciihabitans sp. dw_435 TaxID=2720081 RepID=UPI001BD36646|nr:DUF5684 domain-containing protein [Glaciihabitans sp. dw_435]